MLLLPTGVGAQGAGAKDAINPSSPVVYVAGRDKIRTYRLNKRDGQLVQAGPDFAAHGAGWATWDKHKNNLYAIHSTIAGNIQSPGAVSAFAIDPQTGLLTKKNTLNLGVPGREGIALHPNGRLLYSASFQGNSVFSISVLEDGSIGQVLDSETFTFPFERPHQTVVTKTGDFLLVPCRGREPTLPSLDAGVIAGFLLDPVSGAMTLNQFLTTPPREGPRHLTMHRSERFVWVLNELEGTLTTYAFDKQHGTLAKLQEVDATDPGNNTHEGRSAEIQITPSGRFIYVTNRQEGNIGIFRVDPATGFVTRSAHDYSDGNIIWPRNFAIDETGRFLILANERMNKPPGPVSPEAPTLLVYEINQADGSLTRTQVLQTITGAEWTGIMHLPGVGAP